MANPSIPQPGAKNSGQAISSLIFGILSNTCLWIFGSIPAIILGIKAIKQIDRSGGAVTGRGLAIAGIITGCTGVLIGLTPVGIAASLVVPVVTKVKEKADLAREISEMRQVIIACQSWASDHDGNFPPDLDSLMPDYIQDEELLTWRSKSNPEGARLVYRPGFTESTDIREIVVFSPTAAMGRRLVGYVSGAVQQVDESEFQEP
ncbi:MAG: DUF4190 domain-containing protein [Verrucomicrobiae bacterium]|nr:DUF4190 domain-containing protein [Verrucomicrobiae bacterium]